MDQEAKNQSSYRGVWLICLLMLSIPLICYGIFFYLFDELQEFSPELNEASVRALRFGVGTLFHLLF